MTRERPVLIILLIIYFAWTTMKAFSLMVRTNTIDQALWDLAGWQGGFNLFILLEIALCLAALAALGAIPSSRPTDFLYLPLAPHAP